MAADSDNWGELDKELEKLPLKNEGFDPTQAIIEPSRFPLQQEGGNERQ